MDYVKFKAGQNIDNVQNFSAGTLYLDTATNEFWYDDPAGLTQEHQKIIDIDTLVYKIQSSILDPFQDDDDDNDDATKAILGVGKIGLMILGKS